MSTISKYSEKYNTSLQFDSKPLFKDEYTSMLETQVEKVSNALKLNQHFNERIEALQTQLNTAEDKIRSLTQLVKLQQTYAETQEEELRSYRLQSGRSDPQWERSVQELQQKQKQIQTQLERALTQAETAILQRIESIEKLKNNHRFEAFLQRLSLCQENIQQVQGLLENTNQEIRNLHHAQSLSEQRIEGKVNEAIQTTREVIDEFRQTHAQLTHELNQLKKTKNGLTGILKVSSDSMKKTKSPKKSETDSKNSTKKVKKTAAKPLNKLQQLHDVLVNT